MRIVEYRDIATPILPVPDDLLMLALFARGEQGAWYDPSDLYNYAMERGPELALPLSEWDTNGTASIVQGEVVHAASGSADRAIMQFPGEPGEYFEIEVVSTVTAGQLVMRGAFGTTAFSAGTFRTVLSRANTATFMITGHAQTPTTAVVHSVSLRKLTGIHRATMFQDAEGTIPVTGVEQPVGLIFDKSGNDNHASQVTTTARPTLSARVNLARYSEAQTGAFGSIGNAVPVTVNAPIGETTGIRKLSSGTAYSYATLDGTLGGEVTVSYYVRRLDGEPLNFGSPHTPTSGLNDCTIAVGTARAPEDFTIQPMGGGWYRISATRTDFVSGNFGFLSYNQTAELEVTGLQIEHGLVATRYQRTNTTTDYDWQGWPLYLQRDGVDDVLASGATLTLDDNWHLIHAGQYPYGTETNVTSGFCIAPSSGSASNHFGIGYRPSALYAGAMLRNSFQGAPLVATAGTPQELAGGPHIIEGWASGSVVAHAVDGGATVSVPTDPAYDYGPTPASLHLAGARSVTAATNPVRDYAVLAVHRQLTPMERTTVREILNDKIKVPA